MKRTIAAVVVVIVGVGSCGFEPSPRKPSVETQAFGIKISPETTQITEPLLPNGTPDYAAAVNASTRLGVDLENNAARRLAPVLGMNLSKPVGDRLNVAPEPPPEKRFVGGLSKERYEEFYRLRFASAPPEEIASAFEGLETELEVLERGYCATASCPRIAEWLRANEAPLAAVAEAANQPRFWVPLEEGKNLYRAPTFDLGGLRRACTALGARASLGLGDEDWPGAAADILTAERLGGLLGQSTLLEAQATAAGCIGDGNEALRRAVAEPALDVPAAKTLLSGLQDLPHIGNFELVLQQERFSGLAGVFLLRELATESGGSAWKEILERGGDPKPEGLYRLEVSSIDWNEGMRLVNRSWDLAREVAWSSGEATASEARQRFREGLRFTSEAKSTLEPERVSKLLEEAVRNAEARSELTRAFVTAAELVPKDVTGFLRNIQEPLAERELGIVALALAAYRKEAGRLPDSLEALVPGYLDRMPPATQLGHVLRVNRGDSGELALTLVPQESNVSGSLSYCLDTEGRNLVLSDGREPKVVEGRCTDAVP